MDDKERKKQIRIIGRKFAKTLFANAKRKNMQKKFFFIITFFVQLSHQTKLNQTTTARLWLLYRRTFQTQMQLFIFVNSLYLARNTAPCFTVIWMGNGRWFLPFYLQS